jgi:hypothetical protein
MRCLQYRTSPDEWFLTLSRNSGWRAARSPLCRVGRDSARSLGARVDHLTLKLNTARCTAATAASSKHEAAGQPGRSLLWPVRSIARDSPPFRMVRRFIADPRARRGSKCSCTCRRQLPAIRPAGDFLFDWLSGSPGSSPLSIRPQRVAESTGQHGGRVRGTAWW